jgi:6-phosphogluconolactonase
MLLTGYAGTYASEDNKSLWRFAVDTETGALSKPEPVLAAADSKYLFLQSQNLFAGEADHHAKNLMAAAEKAVPKLLAVPRKVNGKAGLAVVNLDADPLQVVGEYAEEQDCSAYVTGDGEFWYTANYHDGEIRIYKLV